MPFTPSLLNDFGPALPDEDATISPSPTRPRIVKATPGHQDLTLPKSVQSDRYRASPKPNPITVFPAYVHDPPGGLDVPKQGFTGQFPDLDGDDLIHLLNPDAGSQDNFSTDLRMRLSHALARASDATHSMMGAAGEPPNAISPPLSESSSSSGSSPRLGFHSSRLGHSNPQAPPSSALNVPPSAATSVISPFNIYSASATLSFLEWHGIQTNTPLGSAGVSATSQPTGTSGTKTSSSTSHFNLPSRTLFAQTVDTDASGNEHRELSHDAPETVNHNSSIASGDEDREDLCCGSMGGEGSTTSTSLSRSPRLRKRNLPEHLKRCGMVYETPSTKRKPSTPLLHHPRNFPKPPPTIPLPDIPTDDEPPPVPPKDRPAPPQMEKVTIRRLPTIPANSAAPRCEFDITSSSSSIVYTPPPQPPHTSTHTYDRPLRSIASCSATRPLTRRIDSLDSTSSSILSSTATGTTTRSSPCPAGPRQRGSGNNLTPTKSARYANTHVVSSKSMVNMATNSSSPVVTVSRSVSVPRVIPRHVYSKSE